MPAPAPDPWRRPANAALWLAFAAFATALAFQEIRSFDYWWHLRTGALIAETGSVPRADPYTYTVPGARWIDVHWLFQLGLYGIHALGGHAAVVLAQVACVGLLLALLAPIGYRRGRPWITLAGLASLLVVASDRIAPRPELPTFVLLAAVLALLDRFQRRGDAWIYAIVPIQLLWANVHGLFALGIAVCAIHLAGELALPLASRGGGLRWRRLGQLALVTALSALASLANPNGLDGALYPLMQLGMIGPAETRSALGSLIAELQPSLASLKPVPLATFLALAAASLAAIAGNWRRTRPSDALLWAAFLYLALAARRNAAIFAVVAAPLLARNLNQLLDAPENLLGKRAQTLLTGVLALLLAGLAVDVARGRFYERLGRFQTSGLGVVEDYNPAGAVAWIERTRPPGPLAHSMQDGGYLLWHLFPDYPVMVDGRIEVFGPEHFARLWFPNPERFRALDAEYRFGSVLVHYNRTDLDALLGWLHASPDWCLGFVDDVAAVFVKRMSPGGRCPVPELDLDAADLYPPIDGRVPRRDMGRYYARARFYNALGHPDKALEVLQEALRRFPEIPGGAEVRAALEQRARSER